MFTSSSGKIRAVPSRIACIVYSHEVARLGEGKVSEGIFTLVRDYVLYIHLEYFTHFDHSFGIHYRYYRQVKASPPLKSHIRSIQDVEEVQTPQAFPSASLSKERESINFCSRPARETKE
ncbi:hypothetical protein PoB_007615400 [Plakobranchus ocellatus]|uniref:Uncharacterized protein n=1 Tax=Plakobranchus ocellatus TaxID=259542 RepID=A0AAV4DZZ0_9GAST|nr:hypothetical protein PoB_007615400 [Plakobranchus ocellatus]